MATRIYLPSTGSPPVTPSTWNFGAQINPLSFQGFPFKKSTTMTTKTEATGTTNPTARAMFRWVLGPLAAQTITGTVKGQMRGAESNAGANASPAIAIKLIQPGGADRSVLLAQTAGDSAAAGVEFATALTNARFLNASEANPTLTSQSATAGDYLVIELGFRSATATSRNIDMRYGDTGGTDLTDGNTSETTDLVPWIEFSHNFVWQDQSVTGAHCGTSFVAHAMSVIQTVIAAAVPSTFTPHIPSLAHVVVAAACASTFTAHAATVVPGAVDVTGAHVASTFTAHSPTVAIAPSSIQDDFDRADENPIAAPWVNFMGNGIKLLSNKITAITPAGNDGAYYDGTWDDDQSSEVRFAIGDSSLGGVSVRCSGTPGNETGYVFITNFSSFNKLFKWIAGTPTEIGSFSAPTQTDLCRLEVIGDDIELFYNGSSQGSVNDSSITSGKPGVYIQSSGGGSGFLNDWEGKNLGGGGGTPTVVGATCASTFTAHAPTVVFTGDANITNGTCASTFVAHAPKVTPRQYIAADLKAHWKNDEASGAANDSHGANDLTLAGTNQGQDPILGFPARGLEFTADNNLSVAYDSQLAFSSDQAYTFIGRFKFESTAQGTLFYILSKGLADGSAGNREFQFSWIQGTGFQLQVWDAGGSSVSFADPGIANIWTELGSAELDKEFTLAFGYNPTTDKAWIRVYFQLLGWSSRVETNWSGGTRNNGDTLTVGAEYPGDTINNADMAVGALSFFKGNLTDAELEYWQVVHGDYIEIGGNQDVTGGTCGTTFTVHAPTVSTADTVVGGHCASTFTAHAPTVTPQAVTVVGAHLDTTFVAHAPSTTYVLTTAHLDTTFVAHEPVVSAGGITVVAAHLASTFTTFAPTVTPQAVTIVGAHVPSTFSAGAPSLAYVLTTAHLDSTFTAHAPTLAYAVTTAHLASTFSAHAPTVAYALTTAHLASTFTAHAPSVAAGAASVTTAHLASTMTFGPPTVAGAGVVTLAHLVSTFVAHAPTVIPGAVSVTAPHVVSTFTAFAPSLQAVYDVTGAHVPSTFTANPPSVAAVYSLTGAHVASTFVAFAPTLTYVVTLPTVPSTFVAHAPTLTVEAVTVEAATVPSTFVAHPPRVTRVSDLVEPDMYVAENAYFTMHRDTENMNIATQASIESGIIRRTVTTEEGER